MSATVVLLLASAMVVSCALAILVRDVRMGWDALRRTRGGGAGPKTSRFRVVIEAALPFVAILLLVGLTWAAL